MPLVQLQRPISRPPARFPLVDQHARPVRYLRVSLTDRCNYRCTYCMPDGPIAYGARAALLTLEEVHAVCEAFAGWGIRKVRLTGGEPTLRRGIVGLVQRLSAVDTGDGGRLAVVMTSNGERIAPMIAPLRDAGLRGLTISIDSLDDARFRQITRRGDLSRVKAGIDAAVETGGFVVKLNTVAIQGFNDDELSRIAAYAWDRGVVPRFIELMPMSQGELFVPGALMPAAAVRDAIATDLGAQLVPDDGVGVRGDGPATYWRVRGGRHDGRRLGTIAAMTENFCAACNRLRISATGQLHGCLARDDTGDLRSAVRSADPNALSMTVASVLGTKRQGHGFKLDGTGGPQKAMISIGG